MKTIIQFIKPSTFINLFVIFLIGITFGNAQIIESETSNPDKPETELPPNILWDVKAYLPGYQLVKVKAIDSEGNIYPVKAIQYFDDTSMLDVKAIVNGEYLPIKLIVKENEKYYPLKVITKDGTLLDVKAIHESGDILPVKGVTALGTIVKIRAIKDDVFYSIFAISPDGQVNHVKGIKMFKADVETTINEVSIFAHVKALRQN